MNMTKKIDLSFFDRPSILRFIFYPRRDYRTEPSVKNAKDHFIEVEKGISIGCRFYVADSDRPSILYFHGNGEIVGDYDYIAPLYNKIGINLFLADYRGYGLSGGEPTVTNMIQDAHIIFKAFYEILEGEGYEKRFFIMGRSLGSIPAIELGSVYDQSSGIIIESGFAGVFGLLSRFNIAVSDMEDKEGFNENIDRIHTPTLVIHAQNDHLIPLMMGREIYNRIPSKDKRLVIIPDADHNNLMLIGMDQYFEAIEDFVFSHI
jgi:hypothetical protein